MGNRISDLASRFNKAIENESASKQKAEVEAEQEATRKAGLRAAAQEARSELLTELAEFAKSVPALKVKGKKDGSSTWKYEGATLSFTPDGEADRILVAYEGAAEDECLYRTEEDGEAIWILSHGEIAVVLWTTGFDHLCVEGLGLAAPDGYVALHGEEPVVEETEEEIEFSTTPLDTEELQDVRAVLHERKVEYHDGERTRVEGNTHEPWTFRPTNPGRKKKKKEVDPNRIAAGQDTSDYNFRPTHTNKENPRRKRKMSVESGIGSAVKPYKPIIS